jgi:hypothetical protein
MAKYAAKTEVPPDRRRSEIERTLNRYGATAFGYATTRTEAQIMFELGGRQMRFQIALPDQAEYSDMAPTVGDRAHAQAVRQRWAAVALWIKAQCEAIDSEVVTAEDAFLGWVVLPDGQTLGEKLHPQLDAVYKSGQMPALLPGSTRG